jgi:adenosylcobinamide-GDP ribazoletransferase
MIRQLRWAAAFLTVAPVAPAGAPRRGELAASAVFFPLVGAAVGVMFWLVDLACAGRVPDLVRGLAVVAAGAALTRGLHLDGLADTADGLAVLGRRSAMMKAMKDPRVGSFGAVTLVLVVMTQAACIAAVPAATRFGALVAAATAARLALAAAGHLFSSPSGRGLGGGFAGRVSRGTAVAAAVIAVACAAASGGLGGIVALATGTGAGLLLCARVSSRLGGLTGDGLGAAAEAAQTVALLVSVASATALAAAGGS